MKIKIVYLFVALAIIACNKPRIISENEMVKIVTHIFITDAITSSTEIKRNLLNRDSIEYYAPIYGKMGYSTAEFDSSIVYYTRNIALFEHIVDRSIGELSQMETELLALKNITSSDSLRNRGIWVGKRKWVLRGDNINESIDYLIPTHGPGVYTLTAQIYVKDLDTLFRPYVTMSFLLNNNINAYNKCVEINKIDTLQQIKLQQIVFDSRITHVFGSLLWHTSPPTVWAKEAAVSNIKFDFKPIPINECHDEIKILSENLLGIRYAPQAYSKKCNIIIPFKLKVKLDSVTVETKKTESVKPDVPKKKLPPKILPQKVKAEKLFD